MTNTAIINRIDGDEIFLMHIIDYGQKEQTERAFWGIKQEREFKASNPKKFNLTKGEAVQYYIPEGKTIIASFFTLIFPIVAFLGTFGMLSALGLESEKVKAIISIGVMITSFGIDKLLKKIGINETLPEITETLTKENLKEIQKECKDCGSCTICG